MYMNANLAVRRPEPSPTDPAEEALAALYAGQLARRRPRPRPCSPSSSPAGSPSPPIAAMLVALKLKGETADELIGAARALRAADAAFRRGPIICSPTAAAPAATARARSTSRPRSPSSRRRRACRSPSTATARSPRAAARPTCSSSSASGSTCRPRSRAARSTRPASASCSRRLYHPGLSHAGPVRRALKVRTIMNMLGPCVNPAEPPVQLLGVAEPRLLEPVAPTLAALGVERALVVHGAGLDEVALHGETEAVRLARRRDRAADASRPRMPASSARRSPTLQRRRAGGECRAAEGAADGLRHRRRDATRWRSTPARCC